MCQLTDAAVQSRTLARRRRTAGPLTPWKLLLLAFVFGAVGNGYFVYQTVVGPGPLFRLIERIYDFNTVLLPMVCLACGLLGLVRFPREARVRRGTLPVILCWLAGVGGIGVRVYATHIEPYQLQLRTVRIESPKVKHPLRILHVSDIQSPEVGEYERRAFERFCALEPHLILHTGDLLQPLTVESVEPARKRMAALWESVEPPLGKFNVIGDTGQWMRDFLLGGVGGLRTLDGEEVILESEGTRVRILGLRLEQSRNPVLANRVVEPWLATTTPEDFTIVMGHAPDFILELKDFPVDLCLAGHTHGGQVHLPFVGPLITSSRVPRSMARGFFRYGQTRVNVSAGVGCEHVGGIAPIRFNCPPEMTLIELVPGDRSTDSTD
jgi:predicted MPP superfamily phosphohydrolase